MSSHRASSDNATSITLCRDFLGGTLWHTSKTEQEGEGVLCVCVCVSQFVRLCFKGVKIALGAF